jgi:hypothetical protein
MLCQAIEMIAGRKLADQGDDAAQLARRDAQVVNRFLLGPTLEGFAGAIELIRCAEQGLLQELPGVLFGSSLVGLRASSFHPAHVPTHRLHYKPGLARSPRQTT